MGLASTLNNPAKIDGALDLLHSGKPEAAIEVIGDIENLGLDELERVRETAFAAFARPVIMDAQHLNEAVETLRKLGFVICDADIVRWMQPQEVRKYFHGVSFNYVHILELGLENGTVRYDHEAIDLPTRFSRPHIEISESYLVVGAYEGQHYIVAVPDPQVVFSWSSSGRSARLAISMTLDLSVTFDSDQREQDELCDALSKQPIRLTLDEEDVKAFVKDIDGEVEL